MSQKILILIFSFLWLAIPAKSQSDNSLNYGFLETTTERDKFLTYLDTIDKYLYRDAQLVEKIIKECENIIETTSELSNEDLLNYATQKIYIEQNNVDFLKCYLIIKDYESFLQDATISKKVKDNFIYIRAFTYMSLNDWAAAQKAFNEMLEKGRLKKDTGLIATGLYSLGQLYGDDGSHEIAIKNYLEILEIAKNYTIRPSTLSLIDYELGENYVQLEQYEKAKQVIKKGLEDVEKNNMDRLKPDFLYLQGNIALNQNDLEEAEKVFQVMNELTQQTKDPYAIENNMLFHANLLSTQKKYSEAIKLYDQLIEQTDSSALGVLKNIYKNAHPILLTMGEPSKAYAYLEKLQKIEKNMAEQSEKEQRAYFNTKFGSEQKEIENQLLTVKVLKEQNQNRFLYFIAALISLGLLVLFIAYYQKQAFNQTLKKEIKKQTQELANANTQLNQMNQELYQFNKILSHDLREPLRSIVGFSFLAQKEDIQNEAVKEYMRLIEKGGKQLSTIIEDVSTFQDIENHINKTPEWCNFDMLVEAVDKNLKRRYVNIPFQINYTKLPTLYVNSFVLELVFLQLIDNAIKFNQQPTPTINLRYYQEENQHYFEFKDNGVGIEQKFHSLVFDMFKRLNTRDNYEGSGLGLSIVKKMLEKINGTIAILESAPNVGTTFLISVRESKQVKRKSVKKVAEAVVG